MEYGVYGMTGQIAVRSVEEENKQDPESVTIQLLEQAAHIVWEETTKAETATHSYVPVSIAIPPPPPLIGVNITRPLSAI